MVSDVRVLFDGVNLMFKPLNVKAKRWIDRNVASPRTFMNSSLIVRKQDGPKMAAVMATAGLRLTT